MVIFISIIKIKRLFSRVSGKGFNLILDKNLFMWLYVFINVLVVCSVYYVLLWVEVIYYELWII